MHDSKFILYLNQQYASTYCQIKSQSSKYIHTRLDFNYCQGTGCSGMTIYNYHNYMSTFMYYQNIFFKETKYTKVYFYVKDLRRLNKPVTPMVIRNNGTYGT